MTVDLLVQPGSGIAPLLDGIDKAQKTIQIVIFRFDRGEIEAALLRAARRGVFVHALVAFTSTGQGGERTLRNLEMRLLSDGVSVARTATDLVRYHDKLMIIDEQKLFLLGFNYTYIDIERSRSFGIVSEDKTWVGEAIKLFNADATRQHYQPECDTFLVSPGNSRQQLTQFLREAKKELLIYDGKLSDPDMMKILAIKAKEGVDIRVIGRAGKHAMGLKVAPLDMRLHAQAILRDDEALYLGSQSLRTLELDARREVGVIVSEPAAVKKVRETFEADWGRVKNVQSVPLTDAEISAPELPAEEPAAQPALPPALAVKEAVKEAIKDIILENMHDAADPKNVKMAVKEAAKEAVREVTESLL